MDFDLRRTVGLLLDCDSKDLMFIALHPCKCTFLILFHFPSAEPSFQLGCCLFLLAHFDILKSDYFHTFYYFKARFHRCKDSY